jgi:hypothetical protein
MASFRPLPMGAGRLPEGRVREPLVAVRHVDWRFTSMLGHVGSLQPPTAAD